MSGKVWDAGIAVLAGAGIVLCWWSISDGDYLVAAGIAILTAFQLAHVVTKVKGGAE